ncbi:hypothetical protein ACPOL_2482 [Acidisarcina polymorpha]|uniref:Uncharacterized protein n=1 Tax=Acidisarcina polymorpha TaxID=2211140 RepID=A0A2Z5FZ36_9BACT|nr:hypothetical protein [Acidisarcina polymorpha]AXC11804.1 hypothetical protein ACPOL_2482 [Acidisarcina polymorpha]
MKKFGYFALIAVLLGTSAFAEKQTNQATLRDVQPTNFGPAKKKHQQYDLSILVPGRSYQCRTPDNRNFNATDFLVGSMITFTANGKSGEVKTAAGKKEKCTITRVEDAPTQ